jgi:hypothetical protein
LPSALRNVSMFRKLDWQLAHLKYDLIMASTLVSFLLGCSIRTPVIVLSGSSTIFLIVLSVFI